MVLLRLIKDVLGLALVMLLILLVSSEDEIPPKECFENKEIQDVTRLFSKKDIPTSSASDINLEMGWYRIMGDAGNSLKQGFDKFLGTESSPPNFCGTEYAGTLMEEHPTKEEGIVEMTVCFRDRHCFFTILNDCPCQKNQTIYARNCGNHFVYWLFPSPEKMRYCTGNIGLKGPVVKSGNSTAIECSQYKTETSSSRIWDKVSDVSCDTRIGWVRFTDESGTEIASQCTKNTNPITRFGQSCGAEFRGWMIDPHPSLQEGRVARRICFSYSDQCKCEFFTNIYVRNCGDFYVYRLSEIPICNARYCTAPSHSLSKVNDPAKPIVHKTKDLCSSSYNILHDPDRLWSFTSPTVFKCDAHLYGKYRFGSKYTPWTIIEGCNSSDSTIVTHRCGSDYQGYMIGKHPNRKGELVQRIICFQSPKIPCQCQHSVSVDVQNCGDFFVYDFRGVPKCNSRFCMVANKSSAITIDADRPPLYEIPPNGYNPVVAKQEQKKDDSDSLVGTTTVLSIIVFIVLVLLILLVLFVLYIVWPIYRRRRNEKFYHTIEEPKASSNTVSHDEKDATPVNSSIPPYPVEPPPPKPPSEADSEMEMHRGPGSDDDLHTIPEDKELDDTTDEYDTLVKKGDVNKPKPYDNFDTEI